MAKFRLVAIRLEYLNMSYAHMKHDTNSSHATAINSHTG